MKKTVLTVGTALLFMIGSVTFIGCGNSENHDESAAHEHAEGEHKHMVGEEHSDMKMDAEEEHAHYQCPMKCEGDKTYDKAGDCPVCGMELVELAEEEASEH